MRKTFIGADPLSEDMVPKTENSWLDIEELASVEITSEDPLHPIENALGSAETSGWRASCTGPQLIVLTFDQPTPVHRIRVRLVDRSAERSQEFSIHARSGDGDMREIVRQQFTFSPRGSTEETEDFSVDLEGVTRLELHIDPDRAHDPAHSNSYAVLQSIRLA